MLPLRDDVNVVCDDGNIVCDNVNVSSSALSKLWHCRLGHISRGRIERQVKNDILPPLELSDLKQCTECIKGKYIKKSKKDDKRSIGIL